MDEKVGLIGFCCPDGTEREYSYCFTKCENPCYSLPLLASLVKDRTVVPNSYGVLEILDPPQITYLKRHNTWFAKPEDLIWMTFGSGWHKVIEDGGRNLGLMYKHKMEVPFEVEVEGVKLRGRVDYVDEDTGTMIDYKTLKAWFITNMRKTGKMSHYDLQMNVYRVYGFPFVKNMFIEALIKDWTERLFRQDRVSPIEKFAVPLIDDSEIKNLVCDSIARQQVLEEGALTLEDEPCSKEDTWNGRRCRAYCPVAKVCPQLRKK